MDRIGGGHRKRYPGRFRSKPTGLGKINTMRIRTKKTTHEVTISRGEDTAVFTVNPMDVAETNKLLKKFTTHEKHKGQVAPETNYLGFQIAKTQKTIVSWDLLDEDGNTYECNDENKKTAYINNPDLINDVLEKADKIAAGTAEIEEEEEKN